MMKTERPTAPEYLRENYKNWGKDYRQKLIDSNQNNEFSWRNKYEEISNALKAMTQNHCSFCGIYPLRASGATVEHFRPKNKFPLLSYFWGNLFYCCSCCQKKGNRFNRKLLKPDKFSYSFNFYFLYIFSTGIIKPNPRRTVEDQERAEITIELYGLNKFGRPEARVEERKKYFDSNNPNINAFSYRFILI